MNNFSYDHTILINENIRYLSEDERFTNGLPANCIFNKGKVGCGGTSIALDLKHGDYVIAVPFIPLIESKCAQYNYVLGVYKGITKEQIIEYHNSNTIRKYIVTYNSLPRLFDTIELSNFKLLVDEYHLLFTQYSFRRDAIRPVLNLYRKFYEFCFLSATPLEKEFILKELEELPIINAHWRNIDTTTIESVKCIDVCASISKKIQKYITGELQGNPYIYVNSLTTIEFLIKENKLTEINTRVIYSQNNNKEISIPRSSINSKPKKINFLTSFAFEGADLSDEDGVTYILSDGKQKRTLIDISTSFIQIIGRIRDSKHNNKVAHLYINSRYNTKQNLEEFKTACREETEEKKKDILALNNISEKTRESLIIEKNSSFIYKDNNRFAFDENQVKIDIYQYKLTRFLYSQEDNLNAAYLNQGFCVNKYTSKSTFQDNIAYPEKPSYKYMIKTIKKAGYNIKGYCYRDTELSDISNKYLTDNPDIKDAILCPSIGYDGIEKRSYNRQLIKRDLIKADNQSKRKIIAELLKFDGLREDRFYSNQDIKERLKNAYKEAACSKSIKATDIKDYFKTKETQQTIDGKRIKGHKITKMLYL